MKDCKIVCDGKEVASVSCTEDGLNIKYTKEGKKMCGMFKGCC
jgi:hypothetical protein